MATVHIYLCSICSVIKFHCLIVPSSEHVIITHWQCGCTNTAVTSCGSHDYHMKTNVITLRWLANELIRAPDSNHTFTVASSELLTKYFNDGMNTQLTCSSFYWLQGRV